MSNLIFGTLILSVLHAILPNHWLPIVSIARVEKWNYFETFILSSLIAFAHSISTVILGVFVGIMGLRFSQEHDLLTKIFASTVLIILGVFYITRHLKIGNPHHHGFGILSFTGLLLAMFFSPCLEISAFYLIAGTIGIWAIVTISLIYITTTLVLIMGFVLLSLKGFNLLNLNILEHYENLIIGFVLVILGGLSLFWV